MIELTIKPMETDEDGWTEYVLVRSDGDQEEGVTIGYVRQVDHTHWWDARPDGSGAARRFVSLDDALLLLAFRRATFDSDATYTERALQWQ